MTPSELNEIYTRLEAALPRADGMHGRLAMESTHETAQRGAMIWYDDGDACAEVYSNLGLDIDGDAVAEFFAHSMTDVRALLNEIKRLKTIIPAGLVSSENQSALASVQTLPSASPQSQTP